MVVFDQSKSDFGQMRKTLQSLLLFFIVFTIALLSLEFAFRLFRGEELYLKITTGSEKKRSPYLFKPNENFRLKSSKKDEFDVLVKINNFGFRGKDMNLTKDRKIVRIFAVGDSFTFGVGAEENETIPYLLEKNLLKQNLPVEVINAGVGHASTLSHYLKLRDNYLKFKPDMVILLFDFSDLWDDWHSERNLVYDKNGKMLYTDPTFIDGKRNWWIVLVKNSKFFSYINRKVVRTAKKIRVLGLKNYIKAKLEHKRAKAVISNLQNEESNFDTIEYDQYLLIRGRSKLKQIEKHWKRTGKYLLMIKKLLEENNIDFMLVMYPYGIHVGKDQWNEGRLYWGFESGKTYNDYYAFDLVENFARKNNIPYINTLGEFLKTKNEKLFFDLDGHLTPKGNSVLADAISKNKDFKRTSDAFTYPP